MQTVDVLVIGARGAVGREVVAQSLAAGLSVRASLRDLSKANEIPQGASTVAADLTDKQSLVRAMAGARRVFAYSLAESVHAFIDAARASGVEQIVILSSGSVLLPWATNNAIAREHRETEETLFASGLHVTPVRPLVLANNALGWARSIRASNSVSLAWPDSVTAPIHEKDIAAVCVAALQGVKGVDALLTGSEALTQHQQVAKVGEAIGRKLSVNELTEAQAREHFEKFTPPEIAEAIVEFIAKGREPGGSPQTDTIERVLARKAISFSEWASDHRADFA